MELLNKCIKLTGENELEVLMILEALGFTWIGSGSKPTKTRPIKENILLWENPHMLEMFSSGNRKVIGGRVMNCSSMKEISLDDLRSMFVSNNKKPVIKKLSDLIGLENGMGLYIDKNLDVRAIKDDIPLFGAISGIKEELVTWLELLKSMGFDFEYKPKPVRTEKEVLAEMEKLQPLEFKRGEDNWLVTIRNINDGYKAVCVKHTHRIGTTYMTEEQAKKYAEELNEAMAK